MNSPDLIALSWCLAEIREALARAEAALVRYLNAPDEGSLRAASVHLHQAHGALQIVDLDGVSVLTQEAEAIVDRVERGEIAFNANVVTRLSQAFGAVVEYLDELVAGAPHQPVLLFPYYRALLELRGAERVEPADLYFPDLSIRPPRSAGARAADPKAIAGARSEFERALLGFLRQPADPQPLAAMRQAIARLHDAHRASANRAFWWLSLALFDALAHQVLPVDLYVKRLVARINLQIRRTLDQRTPIAERTLKDILFQLARAAPGAPQADAVRALYRLDATVPADFETPRYGRVDARALRSARESTAALKAAWEKLVRGDLQQLQPYGAAVQALATTLRRLPWPGMQRLAAALAAVRRVLGSHDPKPSESLALEVATALLFVEQALEPGQRDEKLRDDRAAEMADRLESICASPGAASAEPPAWLTELSRAAQERLTLACYVAELTANLKACEKALDAFFRDPAQRPGLAELDPLLRQVAGALRLLGHDEAAAGARAIATQVGHFVSESHTPQPQACERVARSLGALGFFVESLQQADRRAGGFGFDSASGEFVARLGERRVAPELDAEDDAPDAAEQDATTGGDAVGRR
ncbi:MAG TPA: hybrid sensor histidine kinase/response regulator, partial [Burkholderiaceae bacterium]|nr:hybrid sensor histidine kinase/response regulator [Burkholderiaceae bacterium]